MKTLRINALNLAVLAVLSGLTGLTALPVAAQSNAEVLAELQALKAKVAELEAQLKAQERARQERTREEPQVPKAPAQGAQWGMTPDQARELNRITVKAEAMEDARDAAGLKLLKVGGYADPTWMANRGRRNSGFNFLDSRAETGYVYDNSYFGSVVLDLQKEMDSGTRWRLTLSPNRGTDTVIGNGGIVQEASVSVPLSDLQTRFIAGHLPDWSGYEYQQATLNKLVTHNLLFDYTLPTTYTGAGLELSRGKWIFKGVVANMNAARNLDGDRAPVIAYRVDYSRGEFQGFGFAGVHGKAVNYADPALEKTRVDLFELDAYFIRGDWTVQGQFSVGSHKGAAIVPDPVSGDLRDARWTGVSALAAYKFSPRFEGIVRLDHVRNAKNGGGLLGYTGYWDPANASHGDVRSGLGVDPTIDCVTDPTVTACNTGTHRTALSMGLSYLWDLNTTLKVEYRLDRANLPAFGYWDGSFRKSNSLLGASVVVAF